MMPTCTISLLQAHDGCRPNLWAKATMALCTRNDFRCLRNRDSRLPGMIWAHALARWKRNTACRIEAWNLFTHVIGMILNRTESERDVRPVVGEPEIDQEVLAESQSDT